MAWYSWNTSSRQGVKRYDIEYQLAFLDFPNILSFLQVAQQCKENIYAIQTLKDFQYLDDNKDQGINVREKAKAMVSLLKVTLIGICFKSHVLLQDDERLKNERVRALKAKERFAQSTAG